MKKIMLTVAAAAISTIIYASPVKAMAIPGHSIVIGDKAYSVDYVVKPANYGEINTQMLNVSNVYYVVNSSTVKDLFNGTYVNTNVIDSIPTITYKDGDGEIYKARSGSNNLEHQLNPFMAMAKVTIGSDLNIFKKISITTVTVPHANYYKIDDSGIQSVSNTISKSISGNSVEVYFYSDSTGNDLVAVGNLDVSSSTTSMDRPITDLSYAVGNSSGNINNLGIVAADSNNQWVYYRGTAGDLYRVKSDGVDRTQLTSAHDAKYINVVGNEVYYVHTTAATKTTPASTGIYKMKADGSDYVPIMSGTKQVGTMGNLVVSSSSTLSDVIVAGDYIYYINDGDGSFHRVSVDSTPDNIIDDRIINTSNKRYTDINIVKNNIYAINTANDENKIYKIDINGFTATKVSDVQAKHLNISGDYMYYRDYVDNEKLYRMNMDGTEKDKLCDDMVYNLNVCGDTIYYKNHSDADRLYMIGIDGTGGQKVTSPVALNKGTKLATDVVEYVNAVGSTVYFSPANLSSVTSISNDGTGRAIMK